MYLSCRVHNLKLIYFIYIIPSGGIQNLTVRSFYSFILQCTYSHSERLNSFQRKMMPLNKIRISRCSVRSLLIPHKKLKNSDEVKYFRNILKLTSF